MEITEGTVVVSLAGHDKGMLFAVVGFSGGEYLLLADGKRRKLEKPKKKKRKHLKVVGAKAVPPCAATNRGLRRALKEIGAAAAAEEGI